MTPKKTLDPVSKANAVETLYHTLCSEAFEFIEDNEYSINSTDLPMGLAAQWQLPVGNRPYDKKVRKELLALDPTGLLLEIPMVIFEHVYFHLYGNPYDKRGIDRTDTDEVEKRLKSDLGFKAELDMFDERFCQYQTLLRHIHIMHVANRKKEILPFDIFDMESYDKVFKQIDSNAIRYNYPSIRR